MPSMRFNCAHLIFKHATNMQNLPAYNKGVITSHARRTYLTEFIRARVTGVKMLFVFCFVSAVFFFFFFFVVLHLLCFGLLDRA